MEEKEVKEVYVVIGGFALLVLLFFFKAWIRYFNSIPPPCDFSKMNDIMMFISIILLIVIPVLFIAGSVDFLITKKIFKTKKVFLITFGILMVLFAIIVPFSDYNCTLKPSDSYKNKEAAQLEQTILSNIPTLSNIEPPSSKGSQRIGLYAKAIDKICFSKDNNPASPIIVNIQFFYKGELIKTSPIATSLKERYPLIEIQENPLCFESKNNAFQIKFENLGDRTRIS